MVRFLLALFVASLAGRACAADRPLVDKPADWVVAVPAPPPEVRDARRASQVLLLNEQDRLTPDGDDNFVERVTRIQTPQGLSEAGAPRFDWDPQTETAVIHKLEIHRDGKIIDLLGTGSGVTVLRRESQLEDDMLDGRLTAVLETEGLRVGDVVDFAYTTHYHETAFGGHSESLFRSPLWSHAAHLFMRVSWPAGKHMNWKVTEGLDAPKLSAGPAGTALEIDMHDVDPPAAPDGAPGRYRGVGQLQVTDLPSWGALAPLLAPLYVQAETAAPDGDVAKEAARIKAATADPGQRALAALALVQQQIRYVFMAMNGGNYRPAPAELTWRRRFGDCKAKSALLVALLHALGIEAEPVLISTDWGDGLDQDLPAVGWFGHVVVRARIGAKVYWMDGTRSGDRSLAPLAGMPYHYALPLQTASLEKLAVVGGAQPDVSTTVGIDARTGIWAPAWAHVSMVMRGDTALWFRRRADNESYTEIKTGIWDGLGNSLDVRTIRNLNYNFDDASGEEHVTFDASVVLDMVPGEGGGDRFLRVHGSQLGGTPLFERDAGPHSDAPFSVSFPDYHELNMEIALPWRGVGFAAQGGAVDVELGGEKLHRDFSLSGGMLRISCSRKSLAPEVAADEAEQAAPALAELARNYVVLRAQVAYRWTRQDMDIRKLAALDDPADLLQRGEQRLWYDDYDGTIADMGAVIKASPGSAAAFGNRGVAYLFKDQKEKARADMEQAALLDPHESSVWRGRAMLAHLAGDDVLAAADMSTALLGDPGDENLLSYRAYYYGRLKRYDEALADWDALADAHPGADGYLVARWSVMQEAGRGEAALAEADAKLRSSPESARLQYGRGSLLLGLGRVHEAASALEKANAISPTADAYVLHASTRDARDTDGKLKDLSAALALEPKSVRALKARAVVYEQQKRYDVAVVDYALVLQARPSDADARFARAMALQHAGRVPDALAELDILVSQQPKVAGWLNDRCWMKATAVVQLQSALADCQAALALEPANANTLDSRGFVYLQLGQLDQAISDYSAALKARPQSASSLYGRAVAEARKGAKDLAGKDLAAARALDPGVEKEYASFGVRPFG